MCDVSIIIVNYNTKELLKKCLESIEKYTIGISYQIIVSDNGSKDGSIEMVKECFKNVILLENNKNLGFGAANNKGLRIATGKYIFYLNSDTELKNNAVKIFYDYWESHINENIGALGTNLLDTNGNYMHSFGELPSLKKFVLEPARFLITSMIKSILMLFIGKIPNRFQKYNKFDKYVGKVGYITGADLFLKNNEFAYFDERFFMYYEESDLELNLYKHGYEMHIIDGPEIFHLEKGSDIGKIQYSFSNIYNEISRIIYYKKNYPLYIYFFIPWVKICVLLTWLNPYYIKKTKKYFCKYMLI